MQFAKHSRIVDEMLMLSFVMRGKSNISIKSYVKKQGGERFMGVIYAMSLTCVQVGTIIA
jgi:hypothetical protein